LLGDIVSSLLRLFVHAGPSQVPGGKGRIHQRHR
jgi:hypothetical protein